MGSLKHAKHGLASTEILLAWPKIIWRHYFSPSPTKVSKTSEFGPPLVVNNLILSSVVETQA